MISLFPNLAPMDIYMLKVLEQMYYEGIQRHPSLKNIIPPQQIELQELNQIPPSP